MKYILVLMLVLTSFTTLANKTKQYSHTYIGTIEELFVWVSGSDQNGIRVVLSKNGGGQCQKGYYLPHTSDNKELVFSTLLAARMSQQPVALQTAGGPNGEYLQIDGYCRINYVKLY
ncbi:hypothetical protein [Pseudoalteromonas viridis]|uniref:Uncharacterized protein n=1 Tax=Pseudoalteromonas viridis TaxID=339617 RepID=A0ABX7V5G3_9GAMM|nr:hypothetical protein [Pseudoalteromonas viridis]QTL35710.1 hypothetical protein J5X90_01220 [Pseudoalteromonas viridis]